MVESLISETPLHDKEGLGVVVSRNYPCLLKTRFAHISVSFVAELRPPLIKGLQMFSAQLFSLTLNNSCTNFTSLRSVKLVCASVKKRINSFVLLSAFTNFATRNKRKKQKNALRPHIHRPRHLHRLAWCRLPHRRSSSHRRAGTRLTGSHRTHHRRHGHLDARVLRQLHVSTQRHQRSRRGKCHRLKHLQHPPHRRMRSSHSTHHHIPRHHTSRRALLNTRIGSPHTPNLRRTPLTTQRSTHTALLHRLHDRHPLRSQRCRRAPDSP